MKNKFQLIMMGVFLVGGLIGFISFTMTKAGKTIPDGTLTGSVSVWGFYPMEIVEGLLSDVRLANPGLTVTYIKKDQKTFNGDFLEALAIGRGPDLLMLEDRDFITYKNKLQSKRSSSCGAW